MARGDKYSRTSRVADLIQNELANLILREVKDPRAQGVVLTRVDVSPDLRNAKVHFSRYGKGKGDEKDLLEEGREGLQRAAGFLQGKLGERLRMKRTPQLSFFIDLNMEHSNRIEKMLANLRKVEEKERPR